ncbi:Werner syndrome ATP-dependent helicase-like isoform X1 [Tripterygium wilfordii]|uniref:DNA 3'-5' helicase n=2 Tax=Tripterygium wilfordii TaxID=458696 RepID=A0A7J7DV38_TRIWF|nr:Werner syndrome ATP-dependent helicase-like isoform X1 [Tripterygium wilfordii]
MGYKAREESHRLFVRDELEVMVATVAFGMGIDKPNIRHVIHYGCPKSLESYYQESGRCGRDGIASVCWLYYTRSDFAKADFYCGDIQSENQRRAIMESLMAAQHYCVLTTCRRKFLLSHFGEAYSTSGCGNCDNCMAPRKEHDFSREALLLMTCIQSCKGDRGLNMPIDVLRGSRSKKILDAHFDKLPLHGLGKDHSSNWWKELAYQLISHGYLVETFKDLYRTVSVSSKGQQYLSSARPDHQPPLVLTMTSEMIKDREFQSTSSEVGEFKSLATPECDGFSKAESQLYHMLLQERMKLARGIGTAPYAICGDQTIKKIALVRPSTKARLANIDGVNQHLVMKHGDHLLQVVRHLSQVLNLSLDGEVSTQDAVASNVDPVPKNKKKLIPAKLEAWRMWHKDGLSFEQIAKLPGRTAPIKEQTVMEYLLEYLVEAAQEGLEKEWMRYCKEIGLTGEVISDIQSAISKVGSADKLKPIKNELPEDISYAHIKACLAMQSFKVSPEVIQHGCHGISRADELTSEVSPIKESQKLEKSVDGTAASCFLDDNKGTSSDTSIHEVEILNVHKELLSPVKRQRVDVPTILTPLEATESSLLNWLENYEEGVPLSDILEHFGGSKEGSVIHLLTGLEADFMVFKKNGMYRLM